MMSEKVKDNPSINETELKSFSEIIKDKIFNKVFAYVVISFLIFNWKDILIILKSKDDILYTLSIVLLVVMSRSLIIGLYPRGFITL